MCIFYSIDGSKSNCMARMVNDSKSGNCVMKKILVGGEPHLCLFVVQHIQPGVELRYDYGDHDNLFWRDKVNLLIFCCFSLVMVQKSTFHGCGFIT